MACAANGFCKNSTPFQDAARRLNRFHFMKPSSAAHFALLFAAALALSSCVVARKAPFNESDFQQTSGKGSGTVTGQLTAGLIHVGWTGNHPKTLVGSNEPITLLPVNAYTDETIQRKFINGENLDNGDPRYARYWRDSQTDDRGHFTFRQLPPGNYYVGAEVQWNTYYWAPDSDNNQQKWAVLHTMLVYARVTVRNGQTSTVIEWHEGKEKKVENLAN